MTPFEQESTAPGHEYREKLWPSWGYWFGAVVFIAVFSVAIWVLSPLWGGITVLISAAVALWFLVGIAARVSVSHGVLQAGAARIELQYCGKVTKLDAAGVSRELGPAGDVRNYGLVRPWVKTAILVQITDPQDPTPNWLISTRNPAALSAALQN